MGKKSKTQQPNAPHLEHLLIDSQMTQQPPHNPYYPILKDNQSPPPYSDLSTPVNHSAPLSSINPSATNYHRFDNMRADVPTIVVRQSANSHIDRRMEKYHRKVKEFSCKVVFVALVSMILSFVSYQLYNRRSCIDYLVAHPRKDVSVMFSDVREAHMTVAYMSFFITILALLRRLVSPGCYPLYVFMIGLVTMVATLITGVLAYLAFYSPCTPDLAHFAANLAKTLAGKFSDKLPDPSEGVFGENNVLQLSSQDQPGLWIFGIDLGIFFLYLSTFLASLC